MATSRIASGNIPSATCHTGQPLSRVAAEQHFTWDARGQLTRISVANTAEQFSYDARGRRIRKIVNGTAMQFLYDGANVLQELSEGATPSINASTISGLSLDETYQQSVANAGKSAYVADRLGTTIALSDAGGNLATTYAYEPYGRMTQSGAATDSSRTFTGREDDGVGLLYFRARYYSPLLQRFISEDPIGIAGGMNFYTYAANNPVNDIDRSGLYTGVDDVVFTVGGAVVGLFGQAAADMMSNKLSGWQDYAGAAAGGAVTGEALLYMGPIAAGALGGAASNLTRQGLKAIGAGPCGSGLNLGSLIGDTLIGAGTGLIGGRGIPGVTSGSNSYNAIFKQMVTKLENGTISNVSLETAVKMFIGRGADTALFEGTLIGAGAGTALGGLLSR